MFPHVLERLSDLAHHRIRDCSCSVRQQRVSCQSNMDTLGPAAESLRLAEQYRQMSDDELIELAQQPSELTESAQVALRQEISSRRLTIPPVEDQHVTNWQPTEVVNDESDDSPYAEERKLKMLVTVWSRRDAEQLQALLVQAGIPFYIGRERATSVDDVRASFTDGLDVRVMKAAFPYVQGLLRHYEPQDEPAEEKQAWDADLAVHCPKCHSTDVVFEHLSGDSHISEGSEEDDSEELDAEDVETEPAATSRKFDWKCAACGYQWEDDGVES